MSENLVGEESAAVVCKNVRRGFFFAVYNVVVGQKLNVCCDSRFVVAV